MPRTASRSLVMIVLVSLALGTAVAQQRSADSRTFGSGNALSAFQTLAHANEELDRVEAEIAGLDQVLHDYDRRLELERELTLLESEVAPLERAHAEVSVTAAELRSARELEGYVQSYSRWSRQPTGVREAEERYRRALAEYERVARPIEAGGPDLTERLRERDELRSRVNYISTLRPGDIGSLVQQQALLAERKAELERTEAFYARSPESVEQERANLRRDLASLEALRDDEDLIVAPVSFLITLTHPVRPSPVPGGGRAATLGESWELFHLPEFRRSAWMSTAIHLSRSELAALLTQAVLEQQISMREAVLWGRTLVALTDITLHELDDTISAVQRQIADLEHRMAVSGRPSSDGTPDPPSVSEVVGGGMPQVIAITEAVAHGWSDVVTVVGSPERDAPSVDLEPAPLSLPAESAVTPLPRSSGTVYGRIDCQRDDGKAWGDRRSWQDYVETGGAQVDWAQGRINLVLRHGLEPGPAFPIARIRADLSPDGSFSATTNRAEIQGQILLDPNTGKLASGSGRRVYRFSPMAATVVYTCVDNFRIEGGR